MSEDLRTRVAKALCENDGLTWDRLGVARTLRGSYLEAADAVLSVYDDDREKLRVLLRSEKERADAAIEREEAADEHATEMQQERDEMASRTAQRAIDMGELRNQLWDLREYAERMEQERNVERAAAERAEAKLRKIEHGCETPESHRYGCPCDRPDAAIWPFLTGPPRVLEQPAPSDVDELRATIVSQAREIARLKGEST
ncbi:hypothetical protein ACIQUY_04800 [Streptomyces sp. NPDC090231]|uniref:hypothetical protein n=1 Tax=unclassified Streptomyces TaxID=2593676 RepID=UPI0037F935AE